MPASASDPQFGGDITGYFRGSSDGGLEPVSGGVAVAGASPPPSDPSWYFPSMMSHTTLVSFGRAVLPGMPSRVCYTRRGPACR